MRSAALLSVAELAAAAGTRSGHLRAVLRSLPTRGRCADAAARLTEKPGEALSLLAPPGAVRAQSRPSDSGDNLIGSFGWAHRSSSRTNLDVRTLRELAVSGDLDRRDASREATLPAVLGWRLVCDPDTYVAAGARGDFASTRPVLVAAAVNGASGVRWRAAAHQMCPPAVPGRLCGDSSSTMVCGAVGNLNCPPKHVAALIAHYDEDIAMAAARHR